MGPATLTGGVQLPVGVVALDAQLEEAVAAGRALVEIGLGHRAVGFGPLEQLQHLKGQAGGRKRRMAVGRDP